MVGRPQFEAWPNGQVVPRFVMDLFWALLVLILAAWNSVMGALDQALDEAHRQGLDCRRYEAGLENDFPSRKSLNRLRFRVEPRRGRWSEIHGVLASAFHSTYASLRSLTNPTRFREERSAFV